MLSLPSRKYQGYEITKIERKMIVIENNKLLVTVCNRGDKNLFLLPINTILWEFIQNIEKEMNITRPYINDVLFIKNFNTFDRDGKRIIISEDGDYIVNAVIVIEKLIAKDNKSWVKIDCKEVKVFMRDGDECTC